MLLPDEVLLKIFQYLTPRDLLSAVDVSKFWSRISRDKLLWQKIVLTWKTLPLDIVDYDSYVSKLAKMCSCLSKVRIDSLVAEKISIVSLVKTLAENCEQLTELHLDNGVTFKVLEMICETWGNSLTVLKIGGVPSHHDINIKVLPKLVKLHIKIIIEDLRIPVNEYLLIYNAVLRLSSLQDLILENFMVNGFHLLRKGIEVGRLCDLKRLALRSIFLRDPYAIVSILESIGHLDYLELDDTIDLDNEIGDAFESLKLMYPQTTFTTTPMLKI